MADCLLLVLLLFLLSLYRDAWQCAELEAHQELEQDWRRVSGQSFIWVVLLVWDQALSRGCKGHGGFGLSSTGEVGCKDVHAASAHMVLGSSAELDVQQAPIGRLVAVQLLVMYFALAALLLVLHWTNSVTWLLELPDYFSDVLFCIPTNFKSTTQQGKLTCILTALSPYCYWLSCIRNPMQRFCTCCFTWAVVCSGQGWHPCMCGESQHGWCASRSCFGGCWPLVGGASLLVPALVLLHAAGICAA